MLFIDCYNIIFVIVVDPHLLVFPKLIFFFYALLYTFVHFIFFIGFFSFDLVSVDSKL